MRPDTNGRIDWTGVPAERGLLVSGPTLVCFGMLGAGFAFNLTPGQFVVFGALVLVAGGDRLWHGISGRELALSTGCCTCALPLVHAGCGCASPRPCSAARMKVMVLPAVIRKPVEAGTHAIWKEVDDVHISTTA